MTGLGLSIQLVNVFSIEQTKQWEVNRREIIPPAIFLFFDM